MVIESNKDHGFCKSDEGSKVDEEWPIDIFLEVFFSEEVQREDEIKNNESDPWELDFMEGGSHNSDEEEEDTN